MVEVNHQSVESEARQQGWTDKEEWVSSGKDPDKWKPADRFVEDGEKFHGVLKNKLAELEQELNKTRSLRSEMETRMKKALVKEQQEKEHLLKQLQQEKAKAITEGDGEAVIRAEQKISELNAQPSAPSEPELDPVTQKWVEKNTWFVKDVGLRSMAEGYAEYLNTSQPYLSQEEFLKQVEEFVKTEAPHKFEAPKGGSPVEGGGKKGGEGLNLDGGNRYEDLPIEARVKCDEYVKDGLMTKEEYVELYYEQE